MNTIKKCVTHTVSLSLLYYYYTDQFKRILCNLLYCPQLVVICTRLHAYAAHTYRPINIHIRVALQIRWKWSSITWLFVYMYMLLHATNRSRCRRSLCVCVCVLCMRGIMECASRSFRDGKPVVTQPYIWAALRSARIINIENLRMLLAPWTHT